MNKPPEPELTGWQRLQKTGRGLVRDAAALTGQVAQQTVDALQDADKRLGITARVQQFGADADRRFSVSEKVNIAGHTVSEAVRSATSNARRVADTHGVTSFVTDNFFEPIGRAVDSVASSKNVQTFSRAGQELYGVTRRVVVEAVAPDLPTYDSYELLQATKRELNYVAACILQITPAESSQIGTQFSRALTAKVAGAASTTALLTLVATFGHAGTGAAIAGLSGAAATSATMAWVGSLVGGGVAAGAALSGGIALVIGLGAYKILASERRAFESLSDMEQRIVQSCWMLAEVANAYQKRPEEFTPEAAGNLLEKMLRPLHRDLSVNIDALCEPLDGKNAIALRQHALADFQSAVIVRLGRYLSWAHSEAGRAWHATLVATAGLKPSTDSPNSEARDEFMAVLHAGQAEAAIAGAFAALLTREALDDSQESRLVVDALRRSSPDLQDASHEQLGDYLRSKSPEELRGIASNVKGIYHELWYVEHYNANHEDTYARVFEATNHSGADVQIVDADTGEVKREIQLKAVESASAVHGHFERYPDIPVVATDEVAARIDAVHVDASGVTNAELEDDVNARFDALQNHTVGVRATDTALLALGIGSAAELMQMLRGERRFPEAVMNTATKAGVAAGATALTALLFG